MFFTILYNNLQIILYSFLDFNILSLYNTCRIRWCAVRKILIVILAILFLISASASVIGFIEHNKSPENKPDPKPKELITYEYYLEEQQQETMPTNSEEASYVFS